MGDKPVYSTLTGTRKPEPAKGKAYSPSAGPTKMRLETKGRGGKAVTVLFNLPFAEDEARHIMKDLQAQAGAGATFKESRIELQGDRRAAVESYFEKRGLKVVRAGG